MLNKIALVDRPEQGVDESVSPNDDQLDRGRGRSFCVAEAL